MMPQYLSKLSVSESKRLIKELGLRSKMPRGYSKMKKEELRLALEPHVRFTQDNLIERTDARRCDLSKKPDVVAKKVKAQVVAEPIVAIDTLTLTDTAQATSAKVAKKTAFVNPAVIDNGKVQKHVKLIEQQISAEAVAPATPATPAKPARASRAAKASEK